MSKGDIHPWVIEGLLYYGLITQEQADEAVDCFEEEWAKAWEDSRWWQAVADIAWHNEASSWEKSKWAGIPPRSWTYEWIKERRGW